MCCVIGYQASHLFQRNKPISSFLQTLLMIFPYQCRYKCRLYDSLFPNKHYVEYLTCFTVQISNKYGLIYVITKLGLLFVYDLETATAVYRNRISPDPIFLTAEASTSGGFYAINRRGQVLLATVNEATIVPFVSGQVFSARSFSMRTPLLLSTSNFCLDFWQLNNLELAVSLAKRGNLPGAEELVT